MDFFFFAFLQPALVWHITQLCYSRFSLTHSLHSHTGTPSIIDLFLHQTQLTLFLVTPYLPSLSQTIWESCEPANFPLLTKDPTPTEAWYGATSILVLWSFWNARQCYLGPTNEWARCVPVLAGLQLIWIIITNAFPAEGTFHHYLPSYLAKKLPIFKAYKSSGSSFNYFNTSSSDSQTVWRWKGKTPVLNKF